MIVEQFLTKYVVEKNQNIMTQFQSIVIIVENQIQMKIWNVFYREYQRFRQQIVQLNIIVFNNYRAYQQFIIQFNKFRNDLIRANQNLVVLQKNLDQKKVIMNFEKQQLNMTNNALQQEIKNRLQTKKCRRKKQMKIQIFVVIVTRFDIITTKNFEFILKNKIDVNVVFNDFVIHVNDVIDLKTLFRQIIFTFQCYKNLIDQLKKQNEHLFHAIEKKKIEMKTLKVNFDQKYNENENTFE